MPSLKLSIIIPCLNEAENITATLDSLQNIRQRGHEIIICDGGSSDNSIALSQNKTDHCISSAAGRAVQMNAGANIATGDILCFLHADTIAPDSIDKILLDTIKKREKNKWGFFEIQLNSSRWQFKVIAWFINNRSCISQVASGDQGIFIFRHVFNQLNGFSNIPLMEDIEISKRLKKISPPLCIKKHKLLTSSRRWEKHGISRTVLLMWKLRLAYFLGVSPKTLSNAYLNHDTKK